MFYCDDCRKKKAWPESFSRSLGKCEICGKVAACNDVSSSQLPKPPEKGFYGIEKITDLAGHRLRSIDDVLTPGSIVTTTGKYSDAFVKTLEFHEWANGAEILTNGTYNRYPKRVHHVESLSEIMKVTAMILSEGDHPIFINLDIDKNCLSTVDSRKDFVLFTCITRKFRQAWNFQVKNGNHLPRVLKDWDLDILTGHFYTAAPDIRGFNRDAETEYRSAEIVFLEKQGFEVEVFAVGKTPWPTRTVGQNFRFDVPFQKIIHLVETKTSEEIPKALAKYYLRK